MTARVKVWLVLGFLVSANLAVWGGKQVLAGALDPIVRALHG